MKNTNAHGILLITVIVIAGMLLAFASALFFYAYHRSQSGDVDLASDKALAMADGGTEVASKAVLQALANYGTIPTAGSFTTAAGQTVTYTVASVGGSRISTSGSTGLYTLYQQFQITSTTSNDNIPRTISTIVDAGKTPIFQFMAFYNNDLEILPGANMTLGGRVHTNGDLYTGAGATLTFNTPYVRAAGNMYRKRKDSNTTMSGTVQALNSGTGSYVNWANGVDSTLSNWSTVDTTNWGGTVQSAVNGVTPLVTPTVPSVSSTGFFHDNAGLTILDGQAYVSGTNVTSSLPLGTLASSTIYDARQGTTVTVTKVDVAKLNSSGKFPSNGLIWAGRSDTTSSAPNGIQLVNGSTLSAGLSIVSPDPVYIQGNYNTVNKKPAAVICDAVNLLSNAWNNSKTSSSGLPTASATTFNAAFITGNVPTPSGGGTYSGGFENLPRFHENWSGQACNITGSFVELWQSQYAKGAWAYGGNRYTAPNRNWAYDTAFDTFSNLPPFTPWTARVGRVAWWEP